MDIETLKIEILGQAESFLNDNDLVLPFFSRVPAGFASPAEDYSAQRLSLTDLVPNPLSSYFVRASGSSCEGFRIFDGSLLVVDRSIKPTKKSVCLCVVNTEFTLKKVRVEMDRVVLVPGNPKFKEMVVTPEMDFSVWGVVTKIITDPS